MKLKSYYFDKYLSKKNSGIINLNVVSSTKVDKKLKNNLDAIEKGVNLTKDLVSEPGNILHPDEYSRRIRELKKFGLKVNIYDKKKLKKMGCNALLGVGQGSIDI